MKPKTPPNPIREWGLLDDGVVRMTTGGGAEPKFLKARGRAAIVLAWNFTLAWIDYAF